MRVYAWMGHVGARVRRATRSRTVCEPTRARRILEAMSARVALILSVPGLAAVCAVVTSCTTIDPGSNYVVPPEQFSADYFYCQVEPKLIFGKHCGDGAGVPGAGSGGCHYSDKVPAMALVQHPPVPCNGNTVTDITQTGAGSPAAQNFSAVSLEMNTDYLNAPLFLWPTQTDSTPHPVLVFSPSDPVVQILATWAQQQ